MSASATLPDIEPGEYTVSAVPVDLGATRLHPLHDNVVSISRPFYVAKFPTTQAQWEAVAGDNPSTLLRKVEQPGWIPISFRMEGLREVPIGSSLIRGDPLNAGDLIRTRIMNYLDLGWL